MRLAVRRLAASAAMARDYNVCRRLAVTRTRRNGNAKTRHEGMKSKMEEEMSILAQGMPRVFFPVVSLSPSLFFLLLSSLASLSLYFSFLHLSCSFLSFVISYLLVLSSFSSLSFSHDFSSMASTYSSVSDDTLSLLSTGCCGEPECVPDQCG